VNIVVGCDTNMYQDLAKEVGLTNPNDDLVVLV